MGGILGVKMPTATVSHSRGAVGDGAGIGSLGTDPPADCRLSVRPAPPSPTPSPRAYAPGPACSPHFHHPKDV